MSKTKKPAVKKSILSWLQEQHDQGLELKIKWDGGGDSGWAYFEIDGDTTENEYTEALVDSMYDILDYGSWAGEFQANGEAIYNPETKCFEGTDYYSEDANDVVGTDIKITVPKSLWFESLHVECECYHDETPSVSIRFIIRNGFLTLAHSNFCDTLDKELVEQFSEIFENYRTLDGNEFRGCNDSFILERKDAVEDGDNLVFTIDKVDIQTSATEDKSIVLELDEEFVNNINKRL